MTDDTISRQAAIDAMMRLQAEDDEAYGCHIQEGFDGKRAKEALEQLPTAERKGHWQITDAYPHNIYCSECHKRFAQTHWTVWEDGSLPRTYCPNCGARMEY